MLSNPIQANPNVVDGILAISRLIDESQTSSHDSSHESWKFSHESKSLN